MLSVSESWAVISIEGVPDLRSISSLPDTDVEGVAGRVEEGVDELVLLSISLLSKSMIWVLRDVVLAEVVVLADNLVVDVGSML